MAHAKISVDATLFFLCTFQAPIASVITRPAIIPTREMKESALIRVGLQIGSVEESEQFAAPIVMIGSKVGQIKSPINMPKALRMTAKEFALEWSPRLPSLDPLRPPVCFMISF